jgi:DNA topoisomerase-1
MDYGFTANMEDFLDKIASGNLNRKKILEDFWKKFKKDLDKAASEAKPIQYVGRKCPQCGGELVYKF